VRRDKGKYHPDIFLPQFFAFVLRAGRLPFYKKCSECGGGIPISGLNRRGGAWPQFSGCNMCGTQWRIAMTAAGFHLCFVFICVPFSVLSLFLTGVLLEFVFPSLIYETETGLRKMRGWAFPFLGIGFVMPVFAFFQSLPLRKCTQ